MVARNDITGDKIQTRDGLSEQGKENWDTIFPPKKKERWIPPPLPDFNEDRIDVIGQNGNDGEHYDQVEDTQTSSD